MTSPPAEGGSGGLAALRALFPATTEVDLEHVLEQCDGNVTWATNLLLDDGASTSPEERQQPTFERAAGDSDSGPDVIVESCSSRSDQGSGTLDSDRSDRSEGTWEPTHQSATASAAVASQFSHPGVPLSGPSAAGEALTASQSAAGAPLAVRPAAELSPAGRPASRDHSPSSGSSSGSSSPSPGPEHELSLTLPPQLAFHLQELFGPTAFGPRTVGQLGELSPAELTVQLPVGLAGELHACWLAGSSRVYDAEQRNFEELRRRVDEMTRLEERSRQDMLRRDEEMARRLQMEEDGKLPSPQTSPTPRLREIMDMEQAFQQSEEAGGGQQASQAERLTRQRLRQEFPGVDPRFLDELMEMHDGDYRQVVQVLQGTRGDQPLPTAALRPPPPPAGATGGWAPDADQDQQLAEGVPSFMDLQAESEVYRCQMKHAVEMASRAVRRNLPGVSQYYVTERDRLAGLLEECRVRAALTTVDLRHGENPDQLDLHELVVDQALVALASFIADRQREFGRRGIRRRTVSVITGRGRHSKENKARIKPAVMGWLRQKEIRYEVAPNNPGMLLVTVDSEHMYRPLLGNRA